MPRAITHRERQRPYAAVVAVKRTKTARAARKRKRRMDRVEHDLTDEQWSWLRSQWGGCAYCNAADGGSHAAADGGSDEADGAAMQRDCVLPISRGGRYTVNNVVPACRSCNASKCNSEVTGWLRRKRMDERAFLIRLAEIQMAARKMWPSS